MKSDELGKVGYEAYKNYTGGVSLVSGDKLPDWDSLSDQIKRAWVFASYEIVRIHESQQKSIQVHPYNAPYTPEDTAGKKKNIWWNK